MLVSLGRYVRLVSRLTYAASYVASMFPLFPLYVHSTLLDTSHIIELL